MGERTYGSPADPRKYDPIRCRKAVSGHGGWWDRQCASKAKRDGWCEVHHPDKEQARRAKSAVAEEERARREKFQRLNWALADLVEMGLSAPAREEIKNLLEVSYEGGA